MIDINILKTANTFARFQTSTQPKFKAPKTNDPVFFERTGCHFDDVRKHSVFVGMIGTNLDYVSLVNNRIKKEMKNDGCTDKEIELTIKGLEEGRRVWGTRVDGVEVEHNGRQYVTIYFMACSENAEDETIRKMERVHRTRSYYFNQRTGEVLDSQIVKEYLAEKNQNLDRQAGNQVLIAPRDFGLDSILSVKINGVLHRA